MASPPSADPTALDEPGSSVPTDELDKVITAPGEAHERVTAVRNSTPDRTPTVQLFLDTAGAYTPSMFWNGPVETITDASTELTQAILRYAPTAAEQSDPTLAMGSMRHELAKVRLPAGGSEDVQVRFPVPGDIVAPIALTVDARPCG